ncbi:hypothetical protein [Xanthovirga aplysinae]|uniref:hypothetical protein n=1 Tax=Xanthovirga aplysinae TaxID=2529853 RepID=UPI0012BBED6C|nr:hypothetical protein [Xanthovirga aplysinae]MTI29999.1 hypothetical protein [Xanthovirga aplysinae]
MEKSIWPYYLPNAWQPHCTMAIDIPEEKYLHTFNTIRNNFQHMEVNIESIGLAEFKPIKLLKECKLKSKEFFSPQKDL